jgi:hypothetical protein
MTTSTVCLAELLRRIAKLSPVSTPCCIETAIIRIPNRKMVEILQIWGDSGGLGCGMYDWAHYPSP